LTTHHTLSTIISYYFQDYFCLERGTLFDNPTVKTLSAEGPLVHTVHCLIDVPQCVASPYEILLPATVDGMDADNGDGFVRGWRLDDATKEQAIALAKAFGKCQDCTVSTGDAGADDAISNGFHIGMRATITDMGDAGTPPTVSAVSFDNADMRVTDPTSTTGGWRFCPNGSDRPAEGAVTAFPTATPTSTPVVVEEPPDEGAGDGQGDQQLEAFSTAFDLQDGLINLAIDVLPETREVSISMTLNRDVGWLAVGVSSDGLMVSAAKRKSSPSFDPYLQLVSIIAD